MQTTLLILAVHLQGFILFICLLIQLFYLPGYCLVWLHNLNSYQSVCADRSCHEGTLRA